ncbi:MAG: (R,R)-butanediol dehydrogenase / meso-butanediol dehydrogenase / diacetyl reductase [Gaiellaceae bacterium]|jgi:(R,R)-butanediol dehydrogenase/meso-butanediol dehydrogenase/diacetyl reductase|nr:(R,R)-butanediol dehydrogenase / meso-butanediol dehydrogenase / diacetyl reductase [Gaiellaceae bacterium]
MHALRFHAAHDLRIEEVAEPTAPGPGEVVVRVVTCGICGTDLHEYMAGPIVTPVEPHPLTGAQNPQILGHEFAGDVVAVGPGVTRVAEGDRVAIMPLAYCGHCAYCQRGLQHLCATMGCVGLSHAWGGMAELATVAEYQIVRLPEGVTYRQGALIEPTAVAAYGVERAGVGPGDRVVVTGAGPIGALAALCARSAGASSVYVSEPNPARRARAEALEVGTVLDPTAVDVPAFLREQSDGLGVDAAIECSGHPNGFATAVRSLRRRGTLAQTGLFVGEATVEPMLWSLNDLTIVGTWCYWVYDFERIAAQIAAGDLPVERVVTSSVALDDGPGAFALLASGEADEIKVLINQ